MERDRDSQGQNCFRYVHTNAYKVRVEILSVEISSFTSNEQRLPPHGGAPREQKLCHLWNACKQDWRFLHCPVLPGPTKESVSFAMYGYGRRVVSMCSYMGQWVGCRGSFQAMPGKLWSKSNNCFDRTLPLPYRISYGCFRFIQVPLPFHPTSFSIVTGLSESGSNDWIWKI